MPQAKNDKMQDNLEARFLPVRRHTSNTARLLNALYILGEFPAPGDFLNGKLKFSWAANNELMYTHKGWAVLTEGATLDYAAIQKHGGPYINFDNNDYLDCASSAYPLDWQNFPTQGGGAALWCWCRPFLNEFSNDDEWIVTKWDEGNNQRSYALRLNGTTKQFEFLTSSDGTDAGKLIATSAYDFNGNPFEWCFVAGLFTGTSGALPNQRRDQRIVVAGATQTDFTIDQIVTVGSNFIVHEGTAKFGINCYHSGGGYQGAESNHIGVFAMRQRDSVDYLRRVFHETRWFYQSEYNGV